MSGSGRLNGFHTYYRHGVVKNVILLSSIPSRLLLELPLPLPLELPRPLPPPLLTLLLILNFVQKRGRFENCNRVSSSSATTHSST